jgi:porin
VATSMSAYLVRWIAASLVLLATCGIARVRADDASGLLDRLKAVGIAPSLTYEGDVAANTSGGDRRGSTYTDNLHVQLMFDGDRLADMPGLSGYLDGLWIGGGQPDKLVGDAQGVSNITGPASIRLYEAWVQYNFLADGMSILAGRYDLNTEFYRLTSAGLFLNSAFGIGSEFGHSGFAGAGPSIFPDTALGVRLAYKPAPNTVFRLAILDGAPINRQDGSPNPFDPHDGVLVVAEASLLTRPATADAPDGGHRFRIGRHGNLQPYEDKLAVGAWYYTASFDAPGATGERTSPRHGEGGAYLLLDRLLFRSAADPNRRVTGFLQLGAANQLLDRFGTYIGTGIVMSGALRARPADEVGLAMAMARNGSSFLEAQQQAQSPATAAETAIEFSYLAQVASWLALQPDVQYVIHPNTDPRLHNATVAQLRFEMTF